MPEYLRQISPKLHRLRSQQNDVKNQQVNQFYANQKIYDKINKKKYYKRFQSHLKSKNILQKKHFSQSQQKLNTLLKQNNQLKKQILDLKVSQFYHFDNKKLKQLLKQVQDLKQQLSQYHIKLKMIQQENQILKKDKQQVKFQLQLINKQKIIFKHNQISNRTLAKTSKILKQDQQLTLGVLQKPIIKSSQNFDDFQQYRLLLETQNSINSKQQQIDSYKQTSHQYTNKFKETNKRPIFSSGPNNPNSPKFGSKDIQQSLQDFKYLNYKSKRKSYNIKNQINY